MLRRLAIALLISSTFASPRAAWSQQTPEAAKAGEKPVEPSTESPQPIYYYTPVVEAEEEDESPWSYTPLGNFSDRGFINSSRAPSFDDRASADRDLLTRESAYPALPTSATNPARAASGVTVHSTTALEAAWRKAAAAWRADPNIGPTNSNARQTRAWDRWLGIVEGHLGVEPPEWWRRRLATEELSTDFRSRVREEPGSGYRQTLAGLWLQEELSAEIEGEFIRFREGEATFRVRGAWLLSWPADTTKTAAQIAAEIGTRCVDVVFDDAGVGYLGVFAPYQLRYMRVARFECGADEPTWIQPIFHNRDTPRTYLYGTGHSGLYYPVPARASLALTPHSVVVFGAERQSINVAEVNRDHGEHLLDFQSYYVTEAFSQEGVR